MGDPVPPLVGGGDRGAGAVKVSILSHDVSDNCVGRAHVLGRLLTPEHEVEIIGPSPDGTIWGPLRDQRDVPIRVLAADQLVARADGDVLYAVKPRGTSLGVALAAQRRRPRPLLVDVDDWEMGLFLDDPTWMARNLLDVGAPNNVYRTALMERRVRRADAVTVSSSWLARRFDGTVVVHSRDTDAFDPALVDGAAARAELGIDPATTVLLFLGSPRRHKGLGTVVQALDLLGRDDLLFLVIGGDPGLPPRADVRVLAAQPFDAIPRFLAAADLVVLAQDAGFAARAQMPAKVYDAMAMGRAIVASDVSDLASTLDGCGVVVPPADPVALARVVAQLADDPVRREGLGAAGRERCVRLYSDAAVRPLVSRLVAQVADRAERR